MAQKVTVLLVDDIDGGTADETVSFSLDGVSYEIDLSAKNAGKMRDAFAQYVGQARRVGVVRHVVAGPVVLAYRNTRQRRRDQRGRLRGPAGRPMVYGGEARAAQALPQQRRLPTAALRQAGVRLLLRPVLLAVADQVEQAAGHRHLHGQGPRD